MPTGATAPDEAAGGGGFVEQPAKAIAIANVVVRAEVRSFIGTREYTLVVADRRIDWPIRDHDKN